MPRLGKVAIVYSVAFLASATFASVYLWRAYHSRENLARTYIAQLKQSNKHFQYPPDNADLVKSILSTGADGISEIVHEIGEVGADGARYSPTPGELLSMFGEAGRAGLHAEFYRNKVEMLLSDDGGLSRQAAVTFLVAALMRHFSDESLLVEWAEQISRSVSYLRNQGEIPSAGDAAAVRALDTSMMYFFESIPKEWRDDGFPELCTVISETDVQALKSWVNKRRAARGGL